MTLLEIRELPEARKLFKLILGAASLWILALILLLQALDLNTQARRDLADADRVVNASIVYKAHPSTNAPKPGSTADDPYAIVSEILASLGLEDRILQLSTQSSGVLLQVERLYGEEMAQLVTLFESQGLSVKTAELKALPVDKERLLTSTFLLETTK